MFKRTLMPIIQEVSASFPILLITGPRQVGKTTLLEMAVSSTRNYVTLDNLEERELAQTDPALFFQKHPPPLIIDEVQYAPNIFSEAKIIVDKAKQPGMFWFTGSQKFHLMKHVTESLAGRVAIIDMLGLSQAEIDGRSDQVQPFMPKNEWITQARNTNKQPKKLMDVYERIWRGSFPRLIQNPEMSREMFYKAYVQTYIQRDVKDILNITDDIAFNRFLSALAARTGQVLNYSDLARDVDIDHKTVKSWLSVLAASGLIYLLYPYYNNVTKRLIKTPKMYFLDTGLCSYLTRWPSAEALESGAMSGAFLETYIFTEILKSYWHNGKSPFFYYYRDQDQREIDLILEEGDTLYPVEFKKTASPGRNSFRHFHVLNSLNKKIGHGGIICFVEQDVPLSREVTAIPVGYL